MEHNKENIDKLFQEKLKGDRHYEIPEAFSADLEKRIAERGADSSKRKWWIFTFVTMVALVSIGAIYLINNNAQTNPENAISSNTLVDNSASNSTNDNDSQSSNQNSEESNNEFEITNKNIESPNVALNEKSKGEFSNTGSSPRDVNTSQQSSTSSNTGGNTRSSNGGSSENNYQNKLNTGVQTNDPYLENNTDSNRTQKDNFSDNGTTSSENTNGFASTETSDSSFEKTNETNGDQSQRDNDKFKESKNNQISSNEPDDQNNLVEGNNNESNTQSDETDQDKNYVNKDVDSTSTNETEINEVSESQPTDSDTTNVAVDTDTTTARPDININTDPNRKKMYLEILGFGGIDLTNSKLITANNSDVSSFADNSTSKITGQYGLGLNFNFNRFFAGIGVSMNQYKDENEYTSWDYTTSYTDSVLFTQVDSIVYDSSQVPIDTISYTIPYDTLQIASTDSTSISNLATNNYKILSLPLSIGYSFGFKNWTLRPRLSAIFELTRQSTTGNYPLASNNTVEQLQSLKFGMSLGFDFQVQRHFGNFYAFARPGYRIRLTNTAGTSTLGIRHNSFQAVAGVGYYFRR